MTIEILEPGVQTTVQGGRRSGLRHKGVPWSGAADSLSMALANRLVGNPPDSAVLEMTFGGVKMRFMRDTAIGLTGAMSAARVFANDVPFHKTVCVPAGGELSVPPPPRGLRTYLSVAGGIDVQLLLGSMSTYLSGNMGGVEGRALRRGDVVCIADPAAAVKMLETPAHLRPFMAQHSTLRVCRSSEFDLLTAKAQKTLFDAHWAVGRRSNRMGLQLEGVPLTFGQTGELSSGMVYPGTVQCPPDGLPFILGPDAQTTGGYPRIIQVIRADRHRVGQLRPGDRCSLTEVSTTQARECLREKQDALQAYAAGARLD